MVLHGSTSLLATGMKKGGMSLLLLWRVLGALVLGALLAKWAWTLFAPHTISITAAPDLGAAPEAGKLFGTAATVVVPAPASRGAEATVLSNARLVGARLVGVFAAESGHSGFAVLKLDDKRQISATAGQDVLPGIRLLEIHPGYVVLEQKGVKQRVNLEGNRSDSPGKPETAAFSPPAAANQASVIRYSAPAATSSMAIGMKPVAVNPSTDVRSKPPITLRPGGLRRWED